jgi:hypothetical protein
MVPAFFAVHSTTRPHIAWAVLPSSEGSCRVAWHPLSPSALGKPVALGCEGATKGAAAGGGFALLVTLLL